LQGYHQGLHVNGLLMPFNSTVIDLRELPKNSVLWEQLERLTVRGWWGKKLFSLIRRKKTFKPTEAYKIMVVYDKGIPVAWGMMVDYNTEIYDPNLYLYTLPNYRRRGIQRDIIIPYWNRQKRKYTCASNTHRQRKTFQHVTDKTFVVTPPPTK
jgi:hypothetical protein